MKIFLLKIQNLINDIRLLFSLLYFPVKTFIQFIKKNEKYHGLEILGIELFIGYICISVIINSLTEQEAFHKMIRDNLSNLISINIGFIAIFFASVVIIFNLDKKYNYSDKRFRLVLKNLPLNLMLLMFSILYLIAFSLLLSYDVNAEKKIITYFYGMSKFILSLTFAAILSTFGTSFGIVDRIVTSFWGKTNEDINIKDT
jgi:small-conductance mechanosensitive channel